jgi:hypothetical protein
MTPVESPVLQDLADDDIVARSLERARMPLASTGIEFDGLTQTVPLEIREWRGKAGAQDPPTE